MMINKHYVYKIMLLKDGWGKLKRAVEHFICFFFSFHAAYKLYPSNIHKMNLNYFPRRLQCSCSVSSAFITVYLI